MIVEGLGQPSENSIMNKLSSFQHINLDNECSRSFKTKTKQSQGENKITLGYMHVTRF